MLSRMQEFFKRRQNDLYLFAAITLVSLSSFALGRLTAPALPKTPITFTESDAAAQFWIPGPNCPEMRR